MKLRYTAGGRSAVVNTLIEDYLRTKEREALHRQITEGCHEMADETRLIEAKFLKADEALHRAIEILKHWCEGKSRVFASVRWKARSRAEPARRWWYRRE